MTHDECTEKKREMKIEKNEGNMGKNLKKSDQQKAILTKNGTEISGNKRTSKQGTKNNLWNAGIGPSVNSHFQRGRVLLTEMRVE